MHVKGTVNGLAFYTSNIKTHDDDDDNVSGKMMGIVVMTVTSLMITIMMMMSVSKSINCPLFSLPSLQ